jgi:type IV pilus assembly protein PilM
MANQPGVWGIDLGQCALKALRVELIDDQVTATAFDYVEHPKILSQPDADPDQLTREALEKFLSRNELRGDIVAISIPGQSGLARFVKLPPVEEKKIPDIVRFEAKQQIPFNLEEVVWDYQKLSSGMVTDGFAMETEIGLFAIKRDTVNRYLQHFRDVNVEVNIVQMAPLALCNYVSYDLLNNEPSEENNRKKCIVALDIGVDNSNLVVTDGGRIIWQRPIPLGGNHFTRALTKDMKLTFAKAEHAKRNATKSPDLKQILSSLKPVLNDFVGEVQRSLGYFTNTHRDASIAYMVGLGAAFRLPGLQKFVSEKLQLEIRRLQQFERLTGDEVTQSPVYTENMVSFAVAYGLVLQGLKVGRLQTNLLPREIQVERLIRAKKPWALTGAAGILLGTAVLALGYNAQYRAVASPGVIDAMKRAKDTKSQADGFASKLNSVKDQIEQDKKAVKSVVVGQDERLDWVKFNQFVNNALPRPDASNLSPAARKQFFNQSARDALTFYNLENISKTKPGQTIPDEEEWRGDLLQVNVEGMYCVYCLDLAQFHSKLKTDQTVKYETMRKSDWEKAPEGKGWIAEIRGYTYYHDGLKFVNEAFVDNLANMAFKPDLLPAGDASAPGASGATGTAAAAAPTAPASTPAPDGAASGKPVDPIINRVSHVVIYDYLPDSNPDPGSFKLINGHVLDSILGGGAGGGGMPGMMGGKMRGMTAGLGGDPGGGGDSGGAPAAMVNAWTPLGSGGGGGPGGGAAPGGMGGMSGGRGGMGGKGGGLNLGAMNAGGGGGANSLRNLAGMSGPPGMGALSRGSGGGSGKIGLGNLGGAGGGSDIQMKADGKKRRLTRTEFVILFVWREPTPSDQLLPEDAPAAGADSPIAR